jgi:hypothetical protein
MKKINFFSFLAASALLIGVSFTSCKSNEPAPDTRTNPSSIAKDSLVAYFPFNSSGVDSVASLTPTANAKVTYVTGERGKCYQGDSLAYLIYTLPSTSKVATMTNGFTVSAWIKSPKVYGDPVPMILQIGKSTDHFWGNLTWMQERAGDLATGGAKDSCYYKFCFQAGGNTQWMADNFWKKFSAAKWQYVTITYNASTSTFSTYVNGVLYSERSKTITPASGALTFSSVDKLIIGAWLTKVLDSATDVWMGYYKGNLDELRIYNAGLSATRVKNLYDAEVSFLD